MKVSAFVARYKILQQLYQQLPGVTSVKYFTDELVKSRIFYAMPSAWQDQFNTTDLQIERKSLNDLMNYFGTLEASERHRTSRAEKGDACLLGVESNFSPVQVQIMCVCEHFAFHCSEL